MSPSKPVARMAAPRRVPKRAAGSRIADERLQSVIDLAVDFYWEQDVHYRFTVYRPSGEPDPELSRLVGNTSAEFFDELAETDGREPLAATLARREVFRDVLHRLGSEAASARYFHLSGQPVFDQRNKFKGYRGIARDVSAYVRAERLAQLESAIAHMLAGANDLATGLTAVIRAMCEALTWTAGNFWTVDAQRDTLKHEVGWNSQGQDRRS